MKIKEVISPFNTKSPEHWGIVSKRHLDMGCGAYARNPFNASEVFGADLLNNPARNLQSENYFKVSEKLTIPVQDGFFGSISAYDFVEHLNRTDGYPNSFISFMNEASRVLAVGGGIASGDPGFSEPRKFSRPHTCKHNYRGHSELFFEYSSRRK